MFRKIRKKALARTEALILHEIYHSYDVVLHVLQKLLRCAVDDSTWRTDL